MDFNCCDWMNSTKSIKFSFGTTLQKLNRKTVIAINHLVTQNWYQDFFGSFGSQDKWLEFMKTTITDHRSVSKSCRQNYAP